MRILLPMEAIIRRHQLLKTRVLTIAQEYKAVLLLGGIIIALGLMMGHPPRSHQEMEAALRSVYDSSAQPIVCKPAKAPPTR